MPNVCLIPHTGTYTVIASAFNDSVLGEYGITAQRINQPGQASVIYRNRPLTASVLTVASIGSATFTAAASSQVQLTMTALSTSLHPVVALYSQDGTQLCSAFSYGKVAQTPTCVLPTTGEYTVLATSLDSGTGSYTLTWNCLSGDCGAVTPPEYRVALPVVKR